jgi:soluble lytic murein transglycosylase-like protein
MSAREFTNISEQAAISRGYGCLSGYLMPPLTVISIGAVMMFLALGAPTVPNLQNRPDQGAQNQSSKAIPPLAPVFTPEIQYWSGRILNWAGAAGLDPNLVATVMQIESCGDPRALSHAGAMGLFQVMPYHFTGSDDPYAPNTNALRGLDYLKRSLETARGDPRLALAGYNGGIGVIGRAESSWAAETQRYAYWGSGIYAEASSGASNSPRLQEWLEANGRSLCRQAHDRLGISP